MFGKEKKTLFRGKLLMSPPQTLKKDHPIIIIATHMSKQLTHLLFLPLFFTLELEIQMLKKLLLLRVKEIGSISNARSVHKRNAICLEHIQYSSRLLHRWGKVWKKKTNIRTEFEYLNLITQYTALNLCWGISQL